MFPTTCWEPIRRLNPNFVRTSFHRKKTFVQFATCKRNHSAATTTATVTNTNKTTTATIATTTNTTTTNATTNTTTITITLTTITTATNTTATSTHVYHHDPSLSLTIGENSSCSCSLDGSKSRLSTWTHCTFIGAMSVQTEKSWIEPVLVRVWEALVFVCWVVWSCCGRIAFATSRV